jgi:hypothetical protein
MSNMSYCRFENTSVAISDCIDVLERYDWDLEEMCEDASSKQEAMAMRRFVRLCMVVAKEIGRE